MWRRTTRVTLLVAWLLFLGAVAYLATHPRLVAPLAARVLTRNLFPDGRTAVVQLRSDVQDGSPEHQKAAKPAALDSEVAGEPVSDEARHPFRAGHDVAADQASGPPGGR